MIKIPTNTKELEEGFNDLKRDVVRETGKAVTTVGKDVGGQVALTDFVKEMYAPSAKGPEAGSGETSGFTDQITPKPGEMFGNIVGSPQEPGQQMQGESALSQMSLPVDQLVNTMVGMPMEPGESAPSEDPFEQLIPSANQVSGHLTGSIPTQKITPHMETAGQQIIPSFDELAGHVGITPSETSGIPGQAQAPAAEPGTMPDTIQNPVSQHPAPQEEMQNPAAAENMQGQPPEVQQMMQQQQQAQQKMEIDRGGIDPGMQMSSEERMKYTEEQKAKREQMMLHDREYRRFGTPLDPIGTLEEQVSKMRQQRKQEDEQRKQEEEEKEDLVKQLQAATGASLAECQRALAQADGDYNKALEMLQQKNLPEPSSKPKPGSVDVDRKKKQAETHRGAAG